MFMRTNLLPLPPNWPPADRYSPVRSRMEAARASVRPATRDDMAAALLDAFGGGEAAPPRFGAEDLRDFLQMQRRALASLHTRRTRQIKALVDERDRLRTAISEQAK